MRIIKRGDIYFVEQVPGAMGSEQQTGRPAIVVSNNACNKFSTVVEVVYLTTRTTKAKLPTHVPINGPERKSTALCEQVDSISIERLGSYMGKLTSTELAKINHALAISLGLAPNAYEQRTKDDLLEKAG